MKYKIDYSRKVRYELMRGMEAVEKIKEKPLGYLPLGCLERHGDHLPMGLDTIKAHGVCCLAAQTFGGIVFPPHHYAGIHMMTPENIKKYTGEWGNIYTDSTAEKNIIDIIKQLETAGIKVLVLYSGHHPGCQTEMMTRITDFYNARKGIRIIPFAENMALSGDHAGLSETSFMLYLDKSLVDMTAITERNHQEHGWPEEKHPEKASVAEGEKRAETVLEYIEKEIGKYRSIL